MKNNHPNIVYKLTKVSKTYQLLGRKPSFVKSLVSGNRPHVFTALKKINLTIRKGDFIGIYGNNGAGKSTLLKIISGIIQPSTGSLVSTGNTLSLINLTAGLLSELNGQENILQQLAFQGIDNKDQQIRLMNEIITFSELDDHIYEPTFTYSSGMLLRLAFSIITAIPADNYIIDEFISVGDAAFREKCFNFIQTLHRQQRTIIVASHDLGWLINNTDKILVLDKGGLTHDESIPTDYLKFYSNSIRRQAKSATISSGSMLPTFKIGQQVKIRSKPYSQINTGDIIVFLFKNFPQPIIHRAIGKGVINHEKVIFTKGDAQGQPDPWVVTKNEYIGTAIVD